MTTNGPKCRWTLTLVVKCTGARSWSNGPANNLTIGNTVISDKKQIFTTTMKHESAHATQSSAFGLSFPALYYTNEAVSQALGKGSCFNLFERAAPPNKRYASC